MNNQYLTVFFMILLLQFATIEALKIDYDRGIISEQLVLKPVRREMTIEKIKHNPAGYILPATTERQSEKKMIPCLRELRAEISTRDDTQNKKPYTITFTTKVSFDHESNENYTKMLFTENDPLFDFKLISSIPEDGTWELDFKKHPILNSLTQIKPESLYENWYAHTLSMILTSLSGLVEKSNPYIPRTYEGEMPIFATIFTKDTTPLDKSCDPADLGFTLHQVNNNFFFILDPPIAFKPLQSPSTSALKKKCLPKTPSIVRNMTPTSQSSFLFVAEELANT